MIKSIKKSDLSFFLITFSYWFFMLTDGALRMLVLLHFHTLGFTPLQLAYLFLLYEFFGMVTNLTAGWIAKTIGLNITLYSGLFLQILSLLLLTQIDKNWSITLSVIFVMATQGLSGIAKDLTKMSSKSSVKLLAPDNNSKLFQWVSFMTGSKNAVKGFGFLLGSLLLTFIGFKSSLFFMAAFLSITLILVLILIKDKLSTTKKDTKFSEVFSKNKNINYLSLGRVFLFGARDTWLVVGLPIFLYSILSDGSIESNRKAFFVIGTFIAGWTVFYGFVQSITPKLVSNKNSTRKQIEFWASALTVIPLFLIPLNFYTQDFLLHITIFVLFVFGFVFAINSSIHSFLILKFTDKNRVTLDVGFYYMSNAFGRLMGTLLSGLSYQYGGFSACVLVAVILLFINRISIKKLDLNNL
ncbi:MAG: organoarsenical effux MFS transporter ArsJ [Alphaproteobacteria bacterium]|nr:organoarsenical effux MFS transporter ArsJ [Alphaproteobacteria bacterium]